MNRKIRLVTIFLFLPFLGNTQNQWTLQQLIDTAMVNSFQLKEAGLQQKISKLETEQNKAARLPSVGFTTNAGYRFGLSENPTTGILAGSNFFSSGFSISANLTVFNWFYKQHQLKAAEAMNEADKWNTKSVERDLVLAINAEYLEAITSQILIGIVALQVNQSKELLQAAKRKEARGVVSPVDVALFTQQILADSLSLIAAQGRYNESILRLKTLTGIDPSIEVQLTAVSLDDLVKDALEDYNPETIFITGLENSPRLKQFAFQDQSISERIKATKAQRYPTLSLYASTASNFVRIPTAQDYIYIPQQATGAKVTVNGTSYDVMAPSFNPKSYGVTPFFRQLHKNFGQLIGLSLSVPILNSRAAAINLRQEKLNLEQNEIQKQKFVQELRLSIYNKFNEATLIKKKALLWQGIVEESTKVFEAAKKQFALNIITAQDLQQLQNTWQKANIELLLTQYDFAFKMKILEFYRYNKWK